MAEADYTKEANFKIEFDKNLNASIEEFKRLFDKSSLLTVVCAPGRVNLIGEHIDYNDGYVLPMAIPLYTIIVASANADADGKCRVKSLEDSLAPNDYVEFSIHDLKRTDSAVHKWINYIQGVVAQFKGKKQSFNAVIKSNVPLGAGLSSSASLEVATYTLLETLSQEFTDLKEKALHCQKAEHEYALVPCGIMDQFISIMGKKDCALLIDCRSLESKLFKLSDPNVAIVTINSNVKHELGGSEYPDRRKGCEKAAKLLNKKSLRDVELKELEDNKHLFDETTYRRARHAVTEIKRTVEAAEALETNDMKKLGKLMIESHYSLKDDYNVSCDELDSLVEIALKSPNVYGSRMTGGGFGGCTVSLVKLESVDELIENVKSSYKGKASFYVCRPCDGAHRVDVRDENYNY